jgi:hypothetical protein
VRNISYFCIVKRLNRFFKTAIVVVICLFFNNIDTATAQEGNDSMDSVEVGLITCSPHQAIYGLFGHTAIRFHDLRTGDDWTFNYGIFNMRIPFFVMRFALGLTDYEMGVMPFDLFCEEYHHFGSSITEQVLNLTNEEKLRLKNALEENYRPENRVYRYNYFYDNCTTRARDMIEHCISGSVDYSENKNIETTYRKTVESFTETHPWASFGINLALGATADRNITPTQQQFIPSTLMHDFSQTMVTRNDGNRHPLVKETRTILKPGVQIIQQEFPLTPNECGVLLLLMTSFITLFEFIKKRIFWEYDVVLMSIQGLAGCLIFFLLFSEHPTTSTNLTTLILNPLPLVFLPRMIKIARKGEKDNYFRWASLVIFTFYLVPIFGIQNFSTAILIMALSLLIRSLSRSSLIITKNK